MQLPLLWRVIGFLGLAFLTAPIAGVALSFGPPEYFALMIFALIATSGLIEKKPFKAILSTLFGLLIATIDLIMSRVNKGLHFVC